MVVAMTYNVHVRGSGSLPAHLTPSLVQQHATRWVPNLFWPRFCEFEPHDLFDDSEIVSV